MLPKSRRIRQNVVNDGGYTSKCRQNVGSVFSATSKCCQNDVLGLGQIFVDFSSAFRWIVDICSIDFRPISLDWPQPHPTIKRNSCYGNIPRTPSGAPCGSY